MVRARLGFAALLMLAANAFCQTAPDLSKDPRLQLPIDIHLKRVLLPDLLTYMRIHSGQKFILQKDLDPVMACVFAKQQPLWKVMQSLADVFGCSWQDLRSEWRLAETKESSNRLRDYRFEERAVLSEDVADRAKALADIASNQAWASIKGSGTPLEGSSPEDETPEQWAARMVRDPAYYIAGIMFSRTNIIGRVGGKFDNRDDFLTTIWPVAYRLIPPPTADIAAANQCGPAGPLAAGLEGSQVLVRSLTWAGTLQAVMVDGGSHRAKPPLRLIRYPRPNPRLAKTQAGKWILDWETDLQDLQEPVLDAALGEMRLEPSPYFGHAQGIEDYLEALAAAGNVPVVCDAFRMPIVGKDPPAKGGTVRQWLDSLQHSQKCFIRVQNGTIMARHGGFWDLCDWEPTEESLSHMDSTLNPGLDDYADFAFQQGRIATLAGRPGTLPFFDTQEVPLTRFNSKPVLDSFLALAAFGQMDDRQRDHILTGGYIDLYRNSFDDTHLETNWFWGKGPNGKPTPVAVTNVVGSGYAGHDYYVNPSADIGVFYGGRPTGIEPRLLETGILPAPYRRIWGDSPDDDPQFVAAFERVSINHAHYFLLRQKPPNFAASADRADRPTFGSFTFFSSVSDVDGVENQVVIPSSGQ